MFRAKTIFTATAVAAMAMGCATPEAERGAGMRVEPVQRVRNGETPDSLYRLGRYFHGQKHYVQAIEAYRQAIALAPRFADAHNALAVAYAAQGNAQLAERSFDAALAAAPNAAYIHANKGFYLMQTGRAEAALTELERAAALDPANARAGANLLAVRRQLGRPGGADAAGTALAAAAPATATVPAAAPIVSVSPAAAVAPPVPAASAVPTATVAASVPLPAASAADASLVQLAPNVWEVRVHPQAPRPTRLAAGSIAAPPPAASPVSAPVPAPVFASVSSPPRAAVPASAGRVEIANGNGQTGLARYVATTLAPQGIATSRLTNAMPYGVQVSKIEYVNGAEQNARLLKEKLPTSLPLVKVAGLERDMQVRVLLGRDFPSKAVLAEAPGLEARRIQPSSLVSDVSSNRRRTAEPAVKL